MDIYTIGGGEIVYEVLKSVSLCLNGGGGTLHGMLTIGGIAAAFMVYFMILYGNIEQILRTWALPLMLMLHLLFLPTATVWIKDTITKYHYKIDKVPYGLAVFASNISKIGLAITEMVEQNFSTPDDMKYQKSGMMFGADILERSKTFKIVNPNFRENMRNFVGQCVKYDIMLNGKYSFEQLRNFSMTLALVSASALKMCWHTFQPVAIALSPVRHALNQAWAAELDKSFSILGRQFFSGRFIGHSGASQNKFVMNSSMEGALKREIIGNLQSTAASVTLDSFTNFDLASASKIAQAYHSECTKVENAPGAITKIYQKDS